MNHRLLSRSVRPSSLARSLLLGALAVGCGAATDDGDPESDARLGSEQSALSETTPTNFKDGFKDLLEISETVSTIYGGPSDVVAVVQLLSEVTGTTRSFETRVTESLEAIRADIRDVIVKIAQDQQTVSEQLASTTISRAATASEMARQHVLNTGGAPFDPSTNPSAAFAHFESRAATMNFMRDPWYWKVSTAPNAPRAFEWRLGLTHLVAAIAMRIQVLAAIDPNFTNSPDFVGELLDYRNHIQMRLAQAEQALIYCFTQPVVIPPGSNLNVPVRFCYNAQTGTQLGVGTIANPIRDAAVRAQLMNEMGFDRIRGFDESLFALANRLPLNAVTCASEHQVCSTSGVKTARYGAAGGYYYRTTSQTFLCGNETFGDPRPGFEKNCTVGELSRTPCANENGNCYFEGIKAIRYGANGSFSNRLALAGIECSNYEFGDPIPGLVKTCTYSDPVWTPCALEGQTCFRSGPSFVRYGFGDRWVYFKAGASFACNNAPGDPAPGITKVCEVATLP